MSERNKLTPEILGQMLFEEFERDGWGDMDPYWFRDPERMPPPGGDTTNGEGMHEVLERVCARLNTREEIRDMIKWIGQRDIEKE